MDTIHFCCYMADYPKGIISFLWRARSALPPKCELAGWPVVWCVCGHALWATGSRPQTAAPSLCYAHSLPALITQQLQALQNTMMVWLNFCISSLFVGPGLYHLTLMFSLHALVKVLFSFSLLPACISVMKGRLVCGSYQPIRLPRPGYLPDLVSLMAASYTCTDMLNSQLMMYHSLFVSIVIYIVLWPICYHIVWICFHFTLLQAYSLTECLYSVAP